ncbi:MAG: type II toxin-antitoxin system prevent-host-death family antitoxin [Chloroflexi bacterium]|nr:type II toxin-antitoxin system prevent-host-death family antitoxin [Chloroflexota bacterium]MBV9897633.1 type II toxin-antitoxin system prevent-host-death family antitoxin [Chloroflexota bacterium]
MSDVSVRELRNHGGEVLDRVARGELITITRDGKPVAMLRPFVRARVTPEALLAHWRRLPPIDVDALRKDTDSIIDSAV